MPSLAQRAEWPISVRTEGEVTLFGLPERLGRQGIDPPHDCKTLEEVVGEGWSERVLSTLMPSDLVWGWWTRSEVLRASGLRAESSPEVVQFENVRALARKSVFLRQMTLVIVPPIAAEQKRVLYWAGQDTDQIADVLFTARAMDSEWRTSELVERCLDRRWRADPGGSLEMVERVVVLADGYTHCGVRSTSAPDILRDLQRLADGWNVAVVSGREDLAW